MTHHEREQLAIIRRRYAHRQEESSPFTSSLAYLEEEEGDADGLGCARGFINVMGGVVLLIILITALLMTAEVVRPFLEGR